MHEQRVRDHPVGRSGANLIIHLIASLFGTAFPLYMIHVLWIMKHGFEPKNISQGPQNMSHDISRPTERVLWTTGKS